MPAVPLAEVPLRFFLPDAVAAARFAFVLALGGTVVGFRRVERLDLELDAAFGWFVSITPRYANHDDLGKFSQIPPKEISKVSGLRGHAPPPRPP